MLLTIIAFILILGFLVLVHELGHFIMARRLGVAVEEFGLGFPPKIWSRLWRGTKYSLNLIPLGGFVKIKGEEGGASEERDSFSSRPVWQRTVIVMAGVVMNVLAGWLILAVLFSTSVPMEITANTNRAYVRSSDVVIADIVPNSPAEATGLKEGDKVMSIDGQQIKQIEDFQAYVAAKAGSSVKLAYSRDNVETIVMVIPEVIKEVEEGRAIIGLELAELGLVRFPVHRAVIASAKATSGYLSRIVLTLGSLVKQIVIGQGLGENLGGPVAIAVATNDMVDLGWPYALLFTAVLSFNLAIINIFPFPALDGGRIVFFIVEKIRGKPSRRLVEDWFHRAGFVLLMLFAIFITYHDIMRFGGRIWSAIAN
ncbi:MAG: RIP metalloprotease RseP [Candidatus Komeilibacteria bacterium RIFCSPLOWO2_02_FULL_48_11]|uniref:Zinc metalloprotease n=1 Tax=Candidatus Komeilibacteria bacterium RIFCSPLOWO2_02_FULL_48_11 TaxID=1798553 RepID=A0A1G2BQG1_9BACT|nr:MAG: RIP metalloprotease RseP [Candidatus Komeilibacteria bacterium RIFCSPLOWO2_02_FULL_48_11]